MFILHSNKEKTFSKLLHEGSKLRKNEHFYFFPEFLYVQNVLLQIIDNRQWTMAMDNRQWTIDNGQWKMENGQWTMDNGQ